MNTFNQQGQQVKNQFNAAGDIHIGNVHNSDLETQVRELIARVDQAIVSGELAPSQGVEVKKELDSITVQATRPGAKKATLVQHLKKAENILKGINAAGGLVEGLKQLGKTITNWFA